MELKEFKFMVGEIIMFSQSIEHDIKLIYSAIKDGKINDNLKEIEKNTLGQNVFLLRDLDYQNKLSIFSRNEYNYLSEITKIRNYYCHQVYLNFIYTDEFDYSEEYKNEVIKIKNDHNKLQEYYENVITIRMKILKEYRNLY